MTRVLARLRVPLGFACGALALWLARPTPRSIAAGMLVAVAGEAIRFWAAGHIEKGREVTRSGPYRFVRASAVSRVRDHGRGVHVGRAEPGR